LCMLDDVWNSEFPSSLHQYEVLVLRTHKAILEVHILPCKK